MPDKKCSECDYFNKFFGTPRGECHGLPPARNSGSSERAQVKVNDMACSLFVPLPPGMETRIKDKAHAQTPGDAAKDAQLNKAGPKKKT